MKVFLGLRETSGYLTRLNEGFHALDIDSTFINLREHRFHYDTDSRWKLVKLYQYITKQYGASRFLMRLLWGSSLFLLSSIFLVWAIARYDIFIFGYGTSFLFLHDLPILKFFGKKIIFVFYGSDARPPYLNGGHIDIDNQQSTLSCIRRTRKTKQHIVKIERYADAIISLPPFGVFHQRPYILFGAVGFPFNFSSNMPWSASANDEVVRILHSPSNPIVKGSAEIEKAVKNLQAHGYKIEWITVKGQPNEIVLQELARCDFVVDQLYSDWLMPGFATEAAAFGKPTIIAGYDLAAMRDQLPDLSLPPVHDCHPDEIEAAIERLILDKAYRLELGLRAQKFVQINWSSTAVAKRFLKIIQNDVPASWYFDPMESSLIHGCGISETRLKKFLQSYIKAGGKDALQLADKPILEQLIIDFAFSSGIAERMD
ncbi:MAG: hypothetical protein ABI690_34070 [Chloroflexota bacterium]